MGGTETDRCANLDWISRIFFLGDWKFSSRIKESILRRTVVVIVFSLVCFYISWSTEKPFARR